MPFLPLHDRNPRVRIERPYVTWALILACVLVFVAETKLAPRELESLAYGFGIVPATLLGDRVLAPELYQVPAVLTLFTSLFLHGDLMHLIGNMAYLFVFGDNIEDSMGHLRFAAFYLICGIAAGLVHILSAPGSEIPTVGASGAISGILGAYLLLHPRAKVLIPIIIIPVYLPAAWLLIFWFGFQAFEAWNVGAEESGVAWWAHIGGFVAGAILVIPFRYKTIPLWGAGDLPSGVTLSPIKSWRRRPATEAKAAKDEPKQGPWQ